MRVTKRETETQRYLPIRPTCHSFPLCLSWFSRAITHSTVNRTTLTHPLSTPGVSFSAFPRLPLPLPPFAPLTHSLTHSLTLLPSRAHALTHFHFPLLPPGAVPPPSIFTPVRHLEPPAWAATQPGSPPLRHPKPERVIHTQSGALEPDLSHPRGPPTSSRQAKSPL